MDQRKDKAMLYYASTFSNWTAIQARGTRNTSLQPPQLQQAERGSGYNLPRLVCEDIATKPSLNSNFITRGETRDIYIVAVWSSSVVVPSNAAGKGSPGVKEGEVMSDSATLRRKEALALSSCRRTFSPSLSAHFEGIKHSA